MTASKEQRKYKLLNHKVMNGLLVLLGFVSFFLLIYKLFELYARRRERLLVLDKIEVLGKAEWSGKKLQLPGFSSFSFSALKGGCLLIGLGLGIFIAFLICSLGFDLYAPGNDSFLNMKIETVIYSASVLLFGGIGLLAAFVLELRMERKERENNSSPTQME